MSTHGQTRTSEAVAPAGSPLARLVEGRPAVRDLLLATAFGMATALGAQVRVRLPFTPVPVTGQVLCVLLAGGLLGPRLGALSQLEYLAMGAAGLPVFAGGAGGPLALAGPTGGYLVAFPLAAALVGWLCARAPGRSVPGTGAACLAGLVVIYMLGAGWLAAGIAFASRAPSMLEGGWPALPSGAGFWAACGQALVLGVVPFVLVDAAKVLLAVPIIAGVRRASSSS